LSFEKVRALATLGRAGPQSSAVYIVIGGFFPNSTNKDSRNFWNIISFLYYRLEHYFITLEAQKDLRQLKLNQFFF
jgi:hypothetical protein